MHWDAKKLFQELPFYNTYIEKSKIKKLSKIKLLQEIPFYNELSIAKKHLDIQEVTELKLLTKEIH